MSSETNAHAIAALFLEERRYPPPKDFARKAKRTRGHLRRDFDEFWENEGRAGYVVRAFRQAPELRNHPPWTPLVGLRP